MSPLPHLSAHLSITGRAMPGEWAQAGHRSAPHGIGPQSHPVSHHLRGAPMRPQQLRRRGRNPFLPIQFNLFDLEQLEPRRLMSIQFASIDGTGNNLLHLDWGSAGIDLLRSAPASYSDGVSAPAGANRPSARAVSNAIAAADPNGTTNDRNLSAFVYAWGQFIDHDIDLTVNGSPADPFNIT